MGFCEFFWGPRPPALFPRGSPGCLSSRRWTSSTWTWVSPLRFMLYTRVSKKAGSGSPYNKGHSILGSILASLFMDIPIEFIGMITGYGTWRQSRDSCGSARNPAGLQEAVRFVPYAAMHHCSPIEVHGNFQNATPARPCDKMHQMVKSTMDTAF